MSRQPSRFPSRRQVRSSGYRQDYMEDNNRFLHEEIDRLNFLIHQERVKCSEQSWIANGFYNELEETRAQLERQKSLTEMFINKGVENKRKLESLQECTDAETLRIAEMGFEAHNEIKYKKKKVLHVDYDELKAAHIDSQEKFSSDLQTEVQKNKAFQEELDRVRSSYQDLKAKYKTNVLAVTKKTETLQQELESEKKSHADKVAQDQHVIKTLRAEQDTIRQKMKQEITSLQQSSKDAEMSLKGELEQIKRSYGGLSYKYETDVLTVRRQADSYQQQLEREVQAHVQTVKKNVELISKMKAEQAALNQTMTLEMTSLRQTSTKKERDFQAEVEGLKTQLKRQISRTDELTSELQERDEFSAPKRKRARRQEPNQEQVFVPVFFPEPEPQIQLSPEPVPQADDEPESMGVTQMSEDLVPETSNAEPLNTTEVSEDTVPQMRAKSPSVWKKARHLLGLRKPEKWKINKSTSNEST